MVALVPPFPGGRDYITSLCSSCAPRDAWSSLEAHVRSFSFAVLAASGTNLNSSTTAAGDRPAQPAATTSPTAGARVSTIAIVGGAVGGTIALVVVLALVYVLRVRRKVERLRMSTNVLGPELMPIPRTSDVTGVAVSQVRPMRLSSTPDYQRHPYLSEGIPPSPRAPPRKLTIDVGVSRAIQHTSRSSASSAQTSTRSPYVVPSPGPTSFPRREPHSAPPLRSARSNV